jgi:6,7-dimethyl-8-ribityllumazine synthase
MSTAAAPGDRIAFLQASWHRELLDHAREAYVDTLADLGYAESQVDVIHVAGAYELPLHAQKLAKTGRYAAIVGAALVVDGGIYRHEFVAAAVVDGLMRVSLDTGVPVLSLSLTPHHFHEHAEHLEYFAGHLAKKGAEAARATAQTIESLSAIDALAG